jgi:hypothetical protein
MDYTEDYTNYFYQVWNNLPESIVSEEYYAKNEDLFGAITFDMYQYDQQCNCLPPFLAEAAIQRIFGNILVNGLR